MSWGANEPGCEVWLGDCEVWCTPPGRATTHTMVRMSWLPQDGSVWNPKVPLCSTVSPLGAPSGNCFTSMQGAPLAYADVPYWLAQKAQCYNPASCNCNGGTPGKRVLLFADQPLRDAPCHGANQMGTQPKCQVSGWPGIAHTWGSRDWKCSGEERSAAILKTPPRAALPVHCSNLILPAARC